MTKGIAATLGFCFLFGLQLVLQQRYLGNNINPIHLMVLTNTTSLAILTAYFLAFDRKVFRVKFDRPLIPWFLAAVFTWMAADVSTMFGLSLSSSINLTLLSRLQVVITYFLAVLFFKEIFHRNKLIAVILSLVGGVILVVNFDKAIRFNIGDVLFLVFTVAISLSGLFRQNVTKRITSFQMTYFMYVVSVAVMGTVTLIFFPIRSVESPAFILFNSLIGVTGFNLVNYAISSGGATLFSVVSSLLPFFTAVFSFVFLSQLPTYNQIIGGLIIVASILLFQAKTADRSVAGSGRRN